MSSNVNIKKELTELKINLNNSIIKNKLKKEGIEKEYIDLQNSLDIYIENFSFIKDEELKNMLSKKLNKLIEYTNSEHINLYKTEFVNLSLYIIEHTPKNQVIDTKNTEAVKQKSIKSKNDAQDSFNIGFNVQPKQKKTEHKEIKEERVKKEYPCILNNNIHIKKKSDIKPSFGVEKIAKTLSDIIIEQPDESGMMIGVFGRWGRGKTYLANQTWEQIKEKKENYIRVDFSAWKYQDTKSSWAYLYELFLEEYLESNKKWYNLKLWKLFQLNKNKYGKSSILFLVFNILLSGIWLFYIDKLSFFVNLISIFGIVILFKLFFFYMQHKKSAIGLFKKYFSKTSFKDILGFQSEIQDEIKVLLQTWIPTIDKNKKVVLFVDDLDRCSTEQIINVLDGLRLILDDEEIYSRLIIVTSIDVKILQKAFYSQKYLLDDKEDKKRDYFKEYLEKVFLVGIKLDVLENDELKEFFDKLIDKDKIREKTVKTPQSKASNEQANKKQSSSKEDRINEDNNKDLFEITQDEKELIDNSLQNLQNPTPRKIRIFYYKYLIAKKLYSKNEEIEDLINSLIEVTNSELITSTNMHIKKITNMVGVL